MTEPYAWNKLERSSNSAIMSARCGHSLTQNSIGVFCFGGVDGRRSASGVYVPNSDLYQLKMMSNSYEWITVQVGNNQAVGAFPPGRSMHTATAIDDNLILVFGGMHCSSPYKALNDMWLLDTRTMVWRECGVVVSKTSTPTSQPAEESTTSVSSVLKEKNQIESVSFGRGNPKDGKKIAFHEKLTSLVCGPIERESELFPGVCTRKSGPSPRHGHTCTKIKNLMGDDENCSLLLFGGCGGFDYSVDHLNDVHVYSTATDRWALLVCSGGAPSPRSGHGAVYLEKTNQLLVFGGWNNETQFNDLFMLDLNKRDWTDLDLSWGVPRWNLSICYVSGLPYSKVFVFGGAVDDRNSEGGSGSAGTRSIGRYDNRIGVLDLRPGAFSWDEPVLEEPLLEAREFMVKEGTKQIVPLCEELAIVPVGREHAAVVYDERRSRLVVVGGWSQRWQDDVWAINVSSIIGPPYAVNRMDPPYGPVRGNVLLKLLGEGFDYRTMTDDDSTSVLVKFTRVGGLEPPEGQQSVEVTGTIESGSTISLVCPNVEQLGFQKVEVRAKIGKKDWTSTCCLFEFFLNTDPKKCICVGPGVLMGGDPNCDTICIVQARNGLDENRTTGGDLVEAQFVDEKISSGTITVKDLNNGRYEIRYMPSSGGPVELSIGVRECKGGVLVPIRGSPYRASFGADTQPGASGALSNSKVKDSFSGKLNQFTGPLVGNCILSGLKELDELIKVKHVEILGGSGTTATTGATVPNVASTSSGTTGGASVLSIMAIRKSITDLRNRQDSIDFRINQVKELLLELDREGAGNEQASKHLRKVMEQLRKLNESVAEKEIEIAPLLASESEKYKALLVQFEKEKVSQYLSEFRSDELFKYETGCVKSLDRLGLFRSRLEALQSQMKHILQVAEFFGFSDLTKSSVELVLVAESELRTATDLWTLISQRQHKSAEYLLQRVAVFNFETAEDQMKLFAKKLRDLKIDKKSDCFVNEIGVIKKWLAFVPLIGGIKDPALRDRHWKSIASLLGGDGVSKTGVSAPYQALDQPLQYFWDLGLFRFADQIDEIVDQARQESRMEKTLEKLKEFWAKCQFVFSAHRGGNTNASDIQTMKMSDDHFDTLEDHQLQVQNMFSSRFVGTFEKQVHYWQSHLASVHDTVCLLNEVQQSWLFLENLFIYSEEVKKELPEDSERFVLINKEVEWILVLGGGIKNCLTFCEQEGIYPKLESCLKMLAECEKSLNDFMESKRRAFPRFYFVSRLDLLDILSNGNTPSKIMVHCPKVFQAIAKFALVDGAREAGSGAPMTGGPIPGGPVLGGPIPGGPISGSPLPVGAMSTAPLPSAPLASGAPPVSFSTRPIATAMESCVGVEYVPLPEPLQLNGKVEVYLDACIGSFRSALRFYTKETLSLYQKLDRGKWIQDSPVAQCVLLTNLINWVRLVESSFLDEGSSANDGATTTSAIIKARDVAMNQLLELIKLTQTSASMEKRNRQKLMCMITLDAHNRDVLDVLINEKVVSVDAFQWQAQLKAYWDVGRETAVLRIADAEFVYGYEYLGNGSRLVVTPLTDRIYVTCTQALHLHMGCAPAGPAGTGKTETTKDLANALGKACFVFNASPEVDYKSMGDLFKGLASSGSYGCFDEFNRLIPEVLSVCSIQFKSICDAVRAKMDRFIIQGDEIAIDRTCGVFITMNPGYLGRSTLPESLSCLFRPVTVMVADYNLIISNSLMSEGFLQSDVLAKKFSTLYALCSDLLSKAKQYDWGMRAIKSVLAVAGVYKRAAAGGGGQQSSEEAILMRALRDTNIAKIDGDDLKIFLGLLQDLFPGVDAPPAHNLSFEKCALETIEENGYTADPEGYLLQKITQLDELIGIRHCVFLMGDPGSFKSSVWKMLAKTREKMGEKVTWADINPKSVSTQELYGFVNLATREWKDGILSKTMRQFSQESAASASSGQKWIVLDGDLDANWIESMNSVMDDNKLLTLPSNERISLKSNMRMLFEIRDLNFATPATVTRAGVVNMVVDELSGGVQWKCFKTSWLNKQKKVWPVHVIDLLDKSFGKFCQSVLSFLAKSCKIQVPIANISFVQSLCVLLENILSERIEYFSKNARNEGDDLRAVSSSSAGSGSAVPRELVEGVFCFCLVWAVGACLGEVDGVDYRKNFSNWWKSEIGRNTFPTKGSVFDYYFSEVTGKMEEWVVPEIVFNSSTHSMNEITVPTSETVANAYFVKRLIHAHYPVMLIGLSGCGKTQQAVGILKSLNSSNFTSYSMNLNYYTDSMLLQSMMEAPLEKKTGRLFGPPGSNVHLVYYIDDLNMPALDAYNTQSGISLLRQYQDYKHWYDRSKMTLKDIGNTQLLCSMNPTAGSFTVDQRLQRHFWTLSVMFPEQSSLSNMFSTYMKGHFDRMSSSFKPGVIETVQQAVRAGLGLHSAVCKSFKKTATNFHYEFNMRHLSGVFGGLLQVQPSPLVDGERIAQLFIHESERVYCDRLINESDVKKFKAILADTVRKCFKFNFTKVFQERNPEQIVFAPFSNGFEEPRYDKVPSMERLNKLVATSLSEYNEMHPEMDLVLFDDALKHVARISRILATGHALLIGVGGSGRQSLARLAAYTNRANCMSIVISSSYGVNELKLDLQNMYNKAGLKDEKIVFLLNDGQISSNEKFLVYINDLLASGDIADLYNAEEKDQLINLIRPIAKSEATESGRVIEDSVDNLWRFFISRIKKNLHVCLCFSPVGDGLRNRVRKFPALINNTVIDWFHPWPKEALKSVAEKYLSQLDVLGDENSSLRKAVTEFVPYSFEIVSGQCEQFVLHERRYAYTTPKSFLELIQLYMSMLNKKLVELDTKHKRLENGLFKLTFTEKQVSELELMLTEKAVEVEEKAKFADEFATRVGLEKATVDEQAAAAAIEAEECAIQEREILAQKQACQRELDQASPLVEKAVAALDVLNKKDFQELKSFVKPPPGVDKVCLAVMQLLAGFDSSIEMDTRGKRKEIKELSWKGCQKMMANPERFLESVKSFKQLLNDEKVPRESVEAARGITKANDFNVDNMRKKSRVAAGLCEWVVNILLYNEVVESIAPKRKALDENTAKLIVAQERLGKVQAHVKELQSKLAALVAEYDGAMSEKKAVMDELDRCRNKLELAHRLINALGANREIWETAIGGISKEREVIPGNVLLACSFVSYLGVFSRDYREKCMSLFVQFFASRNVPVSQNFDLLKILSSEAEIAKWQNFGLPNDRVSSENGSLISASQRFCLLLDPQLQAINWIKSRETANGGKLVVVRMGQPKMVSLFETAIETGQTILIENMTERIDAVIAPVIARNTIRRGNAKYMKLGDREILMNPNFKLILHTKMTNPHFPPEVHAECTVVNFNVTAQGLEEQMMFLIVQLERPELAKQKSDLINSQNEFTVRLADLEDLLLEKLANAQGDILDDTELVISLEDAKRTSDEIREKSEIAKTTELVLNQTSEHYRRCAKRGSLLYFFISDLQKIHSFYKFSLSGFMQVVTRSIQSSAVVAGKQRATSSRGSVSDLSSGGHRKSKKRSVGHEDGGSSELGGGVEFSDLDGTESSLEGGNGLTAGINPLDVRELHERVDSLVKVITAHVFAYISRGLLDQHKLIVATMLCFQILLKSEPDGESGTMAKSNNVKLTWPDVDALVKCLPHPNPGPMSEHLKSWLSETVWAQLKNLESLPGGGVVFKNISNHVESESLSWKRWVSEERLEAMDLPRAYREISMFHKLILVRIFRPDRMTSGMVSFVSSKLGPEFVERVPFDIEKAFSESAPSVPLFFMLFPGVDPTVLVERMVKRVNEGSDKATIVGGGSIRFTNISMGQGQEMFAIDCLKNAAKEGNWIMLQNIHLMQSWLPLLEQTLESIDEFAHPNFRCILSAEPPVLPLTEFIPESILQRSIKIADETPSDIKSNMQRAWSKFSQSVIDSSSRPKEFKACLFSLCLFHSIVVGPKRFGPQGWSRPYPFNDGDLTICGSVLHNYIEKMAGGNVKPIEGNNAGQPAAGEPVEGCDSVVPATDGGEVVSLTEPPTGRDQNTAGTTKQYVGRAPDHRVSVPWPDIRYILGEIMYGGHVTDRWDRRTTNTYLSVLMVPELLGTNMTSAPGIKSLPDASKMDYATYAKYIEERLPQESPQLFGMHSNAEIRFLTNQSQMAFAIIQQVMTGSSVSSVPLSVGNGSSSPYAQTQQLITFTLAQLPKLFDLPAVRSRITEWSPFIIVALQECERMNALLVEIRRSLSELEMGLSGALNISDNMEVLMKSLSMNKVPSAWEKMAYYSLKPLSAWISDLLLRSKQLVDWTTNLMPPKSVWISGLFNPMSYITAVMQVTARLQNAPLDCMTNRCVFTNYHEPDTDLKTGVPPLNGGVYVHGLFLEGASWEDGKGEEEGYIAESKNKIIHTPMPVLNIYAVNRNDMDWNNMYQCPVYVTSARGATYLFTANVRMEPDDTQKRWILAGAALLLSND